MESTLFSYLPTLISFTGLQIIGLISPGPDFAITMRNSLLYSREIGVFTALGIAFGIMGHVIYTLLGVGFFVMQTPWLFNIFKYVGSGYLLYSGYKGLKAPSYIVSAPSPSQNTLSALKAFRSGFLTNALNPKAMLFFLSLFTAFLSPTTPPFIMISYGIIIFTTTFIWFSLVAWGFSNERVRTLFRAFSPWIEKTMGILLILLGLKLFFMKAPLV